jgi:hypothetical protein
MYPGDARSDDPTRYTLPFGRRALDLGQHALYLADWLTDGDPQPTETRYVFRKADKESLTELVERVLPNEQGIGAVDEVGEDVQRQLNGQLADTLGAFHAALPFSEPERHWLQRTMAYEHRKDKDAFAEVQSASDTIVEGGVTRPIVGRDLTRRWWLWRRGADQYEGGDGVTAAALALSEVVELVDFFGPGREGMDDPRLSEVQDAIRRARLSRREQAARTPALT